MIAIATISAALGATALIANAVGGDERLAIDGASPFPVDTELRAAAMVSSLPCEQRYAIADDMYQYPSMREVDCVLSDGRTVSASAFDTRAAALQNLATWQLQGTTRWVVVGDTWFVVGPHDIVSDLGERLGAAGATQKPPGAPAPSRQLAQRTNCVQSASAFLTSRMTNPEQWQEDRDSADRLFPGLAAVIDSVQVDQRGFDRIGNTDTPRFEAWFSRNAPAIKTYCATPPALNNEEF